MTFDFSDDMKFLTDSIVPESLPEPIDEGILGEPVVDREYQEAKESGRLIDLTDELDLPGPEIPSDPEGPSVLDVQSMLVGKETDYTRPRMSYEPA